MVSSTKILRVNPLLYRRIKEKLVELREKSGKRLSLLKLADLIVTFGFEKVLEELSEEELVGLIQTK